MNVTDANKHIAALNRIAEGVTMLDAAIEEAAWEGFEDHAGMPGARPRSPPPNSPNPTWKKPLPNMRPPTSRHPNRRLSRCR